MAVLEVERAARGGIGARPTPPALQRELVRVVSKYAKVPSKGKCACASNAAATATGWS